MREVFQHRGMRLLFVANLISMVGSGMNAAAVIWFILQATHSEVSLGLLVALQTLPSLVLLPFTGVIIDREDRRHLMMWLDVARGLVIVVVAVLAITHRVQVWQVYGMTILVAVGFWLFWPTTKRSSCFAAFHTRPARSSKMRVFPMLTGVPAAGRTPA